MHLPVHEFLGAWRAVDGKHSVTLTHNPVSSDDVVEVADVITVQVSDENCAQK